MGNRLESKPRSHWEQLKSHELTTFNVDAIQCVRITRKWGLGTYLRAVLTLDSENGDAWSCKIEMPSLWFQN